MVVVSCVLWLSFVMVDGVCCWWLFVVRCFFFFLTVVRCRGLSVVACLL